MIEILKELGHIFYEDNLYLFKHKYLASYDFRYYKCKKCGFMFNENSIDIRIIMVFKNISTEGNLIGYKVYTTTYLNENFLPPPNCDELIIRDIIE
jgi:hypothetical protein